MKPVLKWLGFALAGVAGLLIIAVAVVYGTTEVMLRAPSPKAPVRIAAASDPDAVVRGARLAKVYGCNDCHGADLKGSLFFDEMPVARIAAPNLSLAAVHQSDADLARAIRMGVAADGRRLWVMPSEAFAHLTDAETGDLLAYLRSVRPHGEAQPRKAIGPVGRLGALLGKFRSAPDQIRLNGAASPIDLGPQFAHGREIARACMECHGVDLKGSTVTHAPDLMIAGAYDLPDFERLLRTGVAAGGRRLGLMSEIAPRRFNVLSHQEIAALHAYLQARVAAN
ncbi:MAG TPA: c-type cytochrome [Phenylobacterium sp.]|nr:c-type cytochrome [Phenylobacterium sp.]